MGWPKTRELFSAVQGLLFPEAKVKAEEYYHSVVEAESRGHGKPPPAQEPPKVPAHLEVKAQQHARLIRADYDDYPGSPLSPDHCIMLVPLKEATKPA